MKPTFIIGGAAKAGTTTLWELLRAHPQVHMPPVKEVNFFVSDVWYARDQKGWDWYQSLFPLQPGVSAYGEASVNYLVRPESAGLIAERLPEVQLLFILRHPADRLYSHYWYAIQEGFDLPSFETLYAQRLPYWDEIASGSRYELHLPRFLERFPRHQMHVFLFDDLKADPSRLVTELYRAVGVDESYRPPKPSQRANPTGRVRRPWLQRWIIAIEKATFNLDLPVRLRRPLSAVRRRLRKSNLEPAAVPRFDPALRQTIQAEFQPTADYVEGLLERRLDGWRTA